MELHAIPEAPTFLPMVRSQVDFVPQEIMQWNIMEPNAGPNPNCTLKQPTWIFFTSHRKSINAEGLVVAANLETTMGFSSGFLKIPMVLRASAGNPGKAMEV